MVDTETTKEERVANVCETADSTTYQTSVSSVSSVVFSLSRAKEKGAFFTRP